jgi:hypothetical protein
VVDSINVALLEQDRFVIWSDQDGTKGMLSCLRGFDCNSVGLEEIGFDLLKRRFRATAAHLASK